MNTTIHINENELAELKELTGQTDVSSAIRMAITEYVRYVKRTRLKHLSGKIEMEDNWERLEEAEI